MEPRLLRSPGIPEAIELEGGHFPRSRALERSRRWSCSQHFTAPPLQRRRHGGEVAWYFIRRDDEVVNPGFNARTEP